jgi:phosphatidylserine/phosphatidylglycerophosphate/cardiolipin synthase-like enzyme
MGDAEDWFLSAEERGNGWARVDQGASVAGWSAGNRVEVLVDGATYFGRLHDNLCSLRAGDWVHFTDWESMPDQRLRGPGTELATVLEACAARDVQVRGLLWRSHPAQLNFSEQPNFSLTRLVNAAGGEILLDERVRRGGSHHQKLFVIRRGGGSDDDVAFVGGIDLSHGRHDDARHRGDPQAVALNPAFGPNPPWHDVQAQVEGPAVAALADTFRERWEDPTPLDHRNPVRRVIRKFTRQPRHPDPLPPRPTEPSPTGTHVVQVLRTYPAKRPFYPFAREGERRRRLDDGRVRQHEPAFVDPRLRALVRRPRRRPRRARATHVAGRGIDHRDTLACTNPSTCRFGMRGGRDWWRGSSTIPTDAPGRGNAPIATDADD